MDVVLTAPSNAQQLDENLGALEDGPLDPEELVFMRRFGEAGRRRVESLFRWEMVARRLEELYQQVLDDRRRQ